MLNLNKELEAKRLERALRTPSPPHYFGAAVEEHTNESVPETEHPEDDETAIDRWVRLQNEDANLNRRLTAPPNEVRKRSKKQIRPQPKRSTLDNVVDQLRQKQIELVDQQILVQKVMLENALIAKKEAEERLMMVKAQRVCAELDQKRKEREC